MIDFEQLASDIGPDPNAIAVADPPEPDNIAHLADEHDALNSAADRYEEGFEQVLELPPIEDAADFSVVEMPQPEELIKGLVHRGTKVVLGGSSKSFKTWVLLHAAVAIAYGRSWMGCETQPGRVLFVNFEIKKQFFQKRLTKVCEALGVEQVKGRLDVWNLRGHAAHYRTLIPAIIARIKDLGYSAVILDPLYKLYGNTDENSASEVGQLLNAMERVCVETDAAVFFGAHYSKGNQAAKESIDRISGSGVFARDPDTIIPFTKHEDEGCFVVEPVLRNLPPIEPFVVKWDYPLMRRDDDKDPANLKQPGSKTTKEKDPLVLLAAIRGNTLENPISTSDWAKRCGVHRNTIVNHLDNLRMWGLIATVGEGTSARKYITEKGLTQVANL